MSSSGGGGGGGYVPNKLRGVMGSHNHPVGGGAYKSRLKGRKSRPWRVDAASWKQELQERKAVYDHFALPESEEEEKKMVEGESNDDTSPSSPQMEDQIEVVLTETASVTATTTTITTKSSNSKTSTPSKPSPEAPSFSSTALSTPPARPRRQEEDDSLVEQDGDFTPRSYLDRFHASFGGSPGPVTPVDSPAPESMTCQRRRASPPSVGSFHDDDELLASRSNDEEEEEEPTTYPTRSRRGSQDSGYSSATRNSQSSQDSNNSNKSRSRVMSAEEVSTFGFLMRQERILMEQERERQQQEAEEQRLRDEMRKHALAYQAMLEKKQKMKVTATTTTTTTLSEPPPVLQESHSVDDYDDDGILASRSPMASPSHQSIFAQNNDVDEDEGSGDSDASIGEVMDKQTPASPPTDDKWSIRPVPTDEEEEKAEEEESTNDDNHEEDLEDDVQSLIGSALSAIERAATMTEDDDATAKSELMFSALNAIETAAYITHHPDEARSFPASPVRTIINGSERDRQLSLVEISPKEEVASSLLPMLGSTNEPDADARPAVDVVTSGAQPADTNDDEDSIRQPDTMPAALEEVHTPVNPDPLQRARKGLLISDLGRGWHKSPNMKDEEVIETVADGVRQNQRQEVTGVQLPLPPNLADDSGDSDDADANGERRSQEKAEMDVDFSTPKSDDNLKNSSDKASHASDKATASVKNEPPTTVQNDVDSAKKLILTDLTSRLKTVFTGNHHTIESTGNPELKKPRTPVVPDVRAGGKDFQQELHAKLSSMYTDHHQIVESPSMEAQKCLEENDIESGVWIPITPAGSSPQKNGFDDKSPANSSPGRIEEPTETNDQQDVALEEPIEDPDDAIGKAVPSSSDDVGEESCFNDEPEAVDKEPVTIDVTDLEIEPVSREATEISIESDVDGFGSSNAPIVLEDFTKDNTMDDVEDYTADGVHDKFVSDNADTNDGIADMGDQMNESCFELASSDMKRTDEQDIAVAEEQQPCEASAQASKEANAIPDSNSSHMSETTLPIPGESRKEDAFTKNCDEEMTPIETGEEKQVATKAVSLMTGNLALHVSLDASEGCHSLHELSSSTENHVAQEQAGAETSETFMSSSVTTESTQEPQYNTANTLATVSPQEKSASAFPAAEIAEPAQHLELEASNIRESTKKTFSSLEQASEVVADALEEALLTEETTDIPISVPTSQTAELQQETKAITDHAEEVNDWQKLTEETLSMTQATDATHVGMSNGSENSEVCVVDVSLAEDPKILNSSFPLESNLPPDAPSTLQNNTPANSDHQENVPALEIEIAPQSEGVVSPINDPTNTIYPESNKAKKWKDRLASKKASKQTPKAMNMDSSAHSASKETLADTLNLAEDSTEQLSHEQPTVIQGLPPNKSQKWKDRLAQKKGKKSFGGKMEDEEHVETPKASENKRVLVVSQISDITSPHDEEQLLSPSGESKSIGSPMTGSSSKTKKWKDRISRRRSKGSDNNAEDTPKASDMTGRTIITIPSGDDEDATGVVAPLEAPDLNEVPLIIAPKTLEGDSKLRLDEAGHKPGDSVSATALVPTECLSTEDPAETPTNNGPTPEPGYHYSYDANETDTVPTLFSASETETFPGTSTTNSKLTIAAAIEDQQSPTKPAVVRDELQYSFQVFDAILKDRPSLPTDDESVWTEVTIGHETAAYDAAASQGDDQSYMEFTVDESVHYSCIDETVVSEYDQGPRNASAVKTPSMASPSPFMTSLLNSRLYQDVAPQMSDVKPYKGLGDHFEESGKKYPTIMVHSEADDEMTQITMDHDFHLDDDEEDDNLEPLPGTRNDINTVNEEKQEKIAPLQRPPMVRIPSAKSRSSHKSRKSTGGSSVSSQVSSETFKQRIAEILRKEVWSRDISVVQAGLEELSKQAANGRKHRAHIVRCGGIMAITRTMETNSDNADVQISCCETMDKLAEEPESQSAVCEMEGISLIVQCMQVHSDNVKVQEAACSALASICRGGESEDVKESMKEANGAVFTLLTSMTRYSDNARIQAKAFGAIANLCIESRERLSELAEAGGIMTMTLALQKPWANKNEQHGAISSLSILLRGITELNAVASPQKEGKNKLFDNGDDSSLSDMSKSSHDDIENECDDGEIAAEVAVALKQEDVTCRMSIETESMSTKTEKDVKEVVGDGLVVDFEDGKNLEASEKSNPTDETASFATAENGDNQAGAKAQGDKVMLSSIASKELADSGASFESLESLEAIPSIKSNDDDDDATVENVASPTRSVRDADGKGSGKEDEQCALM